MNKLFLIPLIIVLAVGLVFGGCAEPAPAPTPAPTPAPAPAPPAKPAEVKVIKAIVMVNIVDPYLMDRVNPFLDAVNKRLEGEVRIDLVGGAEVVGIFEQADAIKSGVIDFHLYQARGMPAALIPCVLVGDMSQYSGAGERESGAFDVWEEAYAQFLNSQYLGSFDNGDGMPFHLWLNEPIEKIEDLKGLKLRAYGAFEAVAKALGASPILMPLTEIYTAMQRGVVDGYITNSPTVRDQKLYEVSKYVIYPGFFQSTSSAYMNLDTWNSLSKHAQDVIKEEVIKVEELGVEWLRTGNKEAMQEAMDGGLEIHELSPAEGKRLVDTAYEAGWKFALEKDPTGYAERLRPLLTK